MTVWKDWVQVGAARPEGWSQRRADLHQELKNGGHLASGGLKESSPQLLYPRRKR